MYEVTSYDHLLGLKDFSDNALNTHFKLYQGYVANTNKVAEKLKGLDSATPEYAELKRRFGWEFNGMRLHELFFAALTKEKTKLSEKSPLYKKMEESFGSEQGCHDDFAATASMRGIGWAILYQDPANGKLFNTWVNEHDAGHLGSCNILLNLDVFEHAFMLDYGTDRTSYIKAFIEAVDWAVVEKRLV